MVPEGWAEAEVQDIASVSIGLVTTMTTNYRSSGVPLIRNSDIKHNYIRRTKLIFLDPDFANKYPTRSLAAGDVVTVHTGDIGTSAVIEEDLDGCLGFATLNARPNLEIVTSEFLSLYFNSERFINFALRMATGDGRNNFNLKDYRRGRVLLPPLNEQRELSRLEAVWRKAILITENLIENSRAQKKALMQELLTGKRRLPGFCEASELSDSKAGEVPSDWHVDHLSIFASPITRKNSAGVKRVLTASGEHGLVDQREYFKRSVSSEDTSGYYHLKKGEFAYNRSSMKGYPYGAIKRLEDNDEGALSTLYLCFEVDKEACDANFITHLFEAGVLNRQLRKIVQVGARAHGLLNITKKDFFSIYIALPSFEEQRAIAAVLNSADKKTANLKNQLEYLQRQKRALMQQLFTGKRRVKVDKEAG